MISKRQLQRKFENMSSHPKKEENCESTSRAQEEGNSVYHVLLLLLLLLLLLQLRFQFKVKKT